MIWPFVGVALDWWPLWLALLILAVEVVVRIVMAGVVPGRHRPGAAMAWLLVVFFVPVVGLVLYLLIGRAWLTRRRLEAQSLINDELFAHLTHPEIDAGADHLAGAITLTTRLGALPIEGGNRLRLVSDYAESFRWMVEAIEAAQTSIHMCWFIIGDDPRYAGPVLDALERAADRGVTVRFLYDDLGARTVPGSAALLRRLRSSGIEAHPSLPLRPIARRLSRLDLRNHRKIVVVDGREALTGSGNLIEPHYQKDKAKQIGREWVELNVLLTGPAVRALDIVFASDWYIETGEDLALEVLADRSPRVEPRAGIVASSGDSRVQVLPSGPGFPAENVLHLLNHLMHTARHRIVVVTPYLVPDDSFLYAVTGAALRGVDVRVIVSERADKLVVHHAQQSFYEALLEAGVRILRYPAPDLLHAKVVLVDDDRLVTGSPNIDMRSFSLNCEVSLFVVDPVTVASADQVVARYARAASELDLDSWRSRPVWERYLDNVCSPASGCCEPPAEPAGSVHDARSDILPSERGPRSDPRRSQRTVRSQVSSASAPRMHDSVNRPPPSCQAAATTPRCRSSQ
ncbi:MAG: cardiolipin synthase [Mobilicoccus sp.]|nr:cardiolipin synthase [Mobilicoccus sp.]